MRAAALAILAAWGGTSSQEGIPSALWGRKGERWDPKGRLPDFSFAGYRMGAVPIPDVPVRANVRDFGAVGDGKADDTKAFQEALSKTREGAVWVPPGRYVITDFLTIGRSGVVLRGAGPGKTTLYFPRYLNDVKPNWGATTSGRKTSNYSWDYGYVVIQSGFGRRRLAAVAARAERGTRVVVLDRTAGIKAGDFVDLRQVETDGSLTRHLYAGQTGNTGKLDHVRTSFVSRVLEVGADRILLERPLRTDVDPRWKAEVYAFEPAVTDSGVEGLAFEYPCEPYKGHFTELGYNPVTIRNAAHCWVRDIRVVHGDNGPFVSGGRFCTLQRIVLESQREPDKASRCTGHHGITFNYGDDNLVEDFDIRTRFIHDLTVDHGSAGNVFRRGKGVDLSLDHHKRASHANLFANLDAGEGSRLYLCGGGDALGRHSGAWETFWNLRSRRPQRWPPEDFGPDLMNFVGVESGEKPLLDPAGRWWEPIPPGRLLPQDLYEAQRSRRLGSR